MSDAPIARAFGAARAQARAALIPYFTAGFPSAHACRDALRAAERAGADLVEVGIPFSDPLADGPTIQRSTQAALEQGMTVAGVLALVREAALGVPVVLMTYFNTLLAPPIIAVRLARTASAIAPFSLVIRPGRSLANQSSRFAVASASDRARWLCASSIPKNRARSPSLYDSAPG